jgi:urease alpha subunit
MGCLLPNLDDLHCKAVRICGQDIDRPTTVGREALEQGLEEAAVEAGIRERPGSRRRVAAVTDTRSAMRGTLVRNTAVLPVGVDSGDGTVTLEERVLTAESVSEVLLSRRHLLT